MGLRATAFDRLLPTYRAVGRALAPIVTAYLRRRAAAGKEDLSRLGERLGVPSAARPVGPLLWCHAASVGEALSVLPLLSRLLDERPDWHAVLTTGTVTSARLMAEQLPSRAIHQFVPVDLPDAVDRFYAHWRPNLVLWTESDFWPGLIAGARRAGAPLVLINGRISPRSFARWRLWPALIRGLLAYFTLCFAQSRADQAHLKALGAGRVEFVGNLKFAAPPLAAAPDTIAQLAIALGQRPCWLAASTHAGEEEAALMVHHSLAFKHPDLVTLIVPRHPERGRALAASFRRRGLSVALRSAGQGIAADTQIYLADTLGELGLWFRLVSVVFVGGSLVPRGGQNPLEPARLGCAILHGPFMTNFSEIIQAMRQAGAVREVANAAELQAAVARLLFADPAARRDLAARAQAFADDENLTLDRLRAQLAPVFRRVERVDK